MRYPAAYRIHAQIGGNNYHLFACRHSGQEIWAAGLHHLVKNAGNAQVFPDTELHEIYVNSLFSSKEVYGLAKYFYEIFGIEIVVAEQPFPLPLPYSYGYLKFNDGKSEPESQSISHEEAQMPLPLLSFIHHVVGEFDEVWKEANFANDFTPLNRLQISANSFTMEPEADALPVSFPVFACVEKEQICFFDQLKGVHTLTEAHHEDENLRFREHNLNFSNQQVIEFAYFFKDTIDELTRSHAKLYFDPGQLFFRMLSQNPHDAEDCGT